tara:strand:+ start:4875 stop:6599 length:1725 start_codon:yes stop_codon:yes gene_type:complete
MKIQSKYMYGGKSTYRKGGYIPQTQMSREELDKKAYGPSKGPQRFTRKDVEPQTKSKRKDVKPQTQMTRKELDNLVSKKEKSKTTTNNNKVNNKESKTGSKIYNLKNDKNWEYKVEDNKWFTRKKGTTKFFDLSGDKFKSAVEKLDKEHPNARTRTMEKGGTLMQRYAKAYQEGGTTDGLTNQLKIYKNMYGDLPESGKPMEATGFFEIASKGKGGKKWSELLKNYKISFNDDKEFRKLARTDDLVNDALQAYRSYKRATEQNHRKIVEKGVAGDDIGMYQGFFGEGKFKDFKNKFVSEMGQKVQAKLKEIRQKEKDGRVPLTPEEQFLLDGIIPSRIVDPFDYQDDSEGLVKAEAEASKKMADYWTSQGIKFKTNQSGNQVIDYGGTDRKALDSNNRPNLSDKSEEVKLSDNKTSETDQKKVDTKPDLTLQKIGPTKVDTDDSSDLMANQEMKTTETRNDTREKVTEEYIPQSMRNIAPQTVVNRRNENNKPEDNTDEVETSVKTTNNNNVTSDTGMNTGDDFSGPNPYDYGSEEYFDWKKRKRAAMFAKRGALVKKINYLKGGIYGKRNFRR